MRVRVRARVRDKVRARVGVRVVRVNGLTLPSYRGQVVRKQYDRTMTLFTILTDLCFSNLRGIILQYNTSNVLLV